MILLEHPEAIEYTVEMMAGIAMDLMIILMMKTGMMTDFNNRPR